MVQGIDSRYYCVKLGMKLTTTMCCSWITGTSMNCKNFPWNKRWFLWFYAPEALDFGRVSRFGGWATWIPLYHIKYKEHIFLSGNVESCISCKCCLDLRQCTASLSVRNLRTPGSIFINSSWRLSYPSELHSIISFSSVCGTSASMLTGDLWLLLPISQAVPKYTDTVNVDSIRFFSRWGTGYWRFDISYFAVFNFHRIAKNNIWRTFAISQEMTLERKYSFHDLHWTPFGSIATVHHA